jgi:hypothetical protein
MVIKQFDEFNGVWYDVTGVAGETLRFDNNGQIQDSPILWGDISGDIGAQNDLKDEFSKYVSLGSWIDYSSTSTITGFSTISTRKIRYLQLGMTRIVHYQIIGTSNATTTSFTLPFSGSSFADQFFVGHAINNTTTHNICMARILASGSTVDLFLGNNTTTNVWTASGTKRAEGTLTIAI